MRERDIEAALVQRVKANGGEVRKLKWIGRNGAPDRLVLLPDLPGVVSFIELKATGEQLEPHQKREHERLRALGADVRVIDSLETLERWAQTRELA